MNSYQRYAQRLCHQVERRIGRHLSGRLEAVDVLQSAFRTFFRRAANGEFQIDHTGDLWNLLVTITLNKIRGQAEHHCALKRDPRRELRIGEQICSGRNRLRAVRSGSDCAGRRAGDVAGTDPEAWRPRLCVCVWQATLRWRLPAQASAVSRHRLAQAGSRELSAANSPAGIC